MIIFMSESKTDTIVRATITPAGEITLVPEKAFDKGAFLARIAKLHASMAMSSPVVETMRKKARY